MILNILEYRSFDVRVAGKLRETQQDSPRSGSAFAECLRERQGAAGRFKNGENRETGGNGGRSSWMIAYNATA